MNHYAGNSEVFEHDGVLSILHLQDGLANTLMIGEVNGEFVPWGQPLNSRDPRVGINTPSGFGGAKGSRGATFSMMDGSVRFVSEDIDPKVLESLSQLSFDR